MRQAKDHNTWCLQIHKINKDAKKAQVIFRLHKTEKNTLEGTQGQEEKCSPREMLVISKITERKQSDVTQGRAFILFELS